MIIQKKSETDSRKNHDFPDPSPLSARPPAAATRKPSLSRHSPSNRTPAGPKDLASPGFFLDALGYRYSPSAGVAQEKSQPPPAVQQKQHAVHPADLPELWVQKWVDYSSKYGIGYVFSDGAIGVYFNDSTKIILDQGGSAGLGASGAGGGSSSSAAARSLDGPQQFEYITRRTVDKPEQRFVHSLESFPEDLRKKVTLLKHFKNYLMVNGHSKENSQATLGE